jgi:hypothetical protein
MTIISTFGGLCSLGMFGRRPLRGLTDAQLDVMSRAFTAAAQQDLFDGAEDRALAKLLYDEAAVRNLMWGDPDGGNRHFVPRRQARHQTR